MTFDEAMKLAMIAMAGFPGIQDKNVRPIALIWSRVLEDVPYEIAEQALMRVLARVKYFPTAAELREAVLEMTSEELPTAWEAWAEVRRTVQKYGFYEPQAAQSDLNPLVWKAVSVIGWREICLTDEPEIVRAQFVRVYDTLLRRERDERSLPMALRAGGYLPKSLPERRKKVATPAFPVSDIGDTTEAVSGNGHPGD